MWGKGFSVDRFRIKIGMNGWIRKRNNSFKILEMTIKDIEM